MRERKSKEFILKKLHEKKRKEKEIAYRCDILDILAFGVPFGAQ